VLQVLRVLPNGILLLIAALLLVLAPVAHSEEPPEDFEADREAGYLGISGVYARQDMSDSNSIGLRVGDSGGLSARMGFRMMRYAAVEIEGEWLYNLGSGIENPWNIIANFKAIYPLGPQDRIQPYLVGGAGVTSARFKPAGRPSYVDTDGVYKLGGGLDFFLTRHWVVGTEASWTNGMSKSPGLTHISVEAGVTYVFR
jgi:opacity protein-like surface antigen